MKERNYTNNYKNLQYYESKYVSSSKQDNEFDLINEKKYDYVIKRSPNSSKNKDISNGSRINENINKKLNRKSYYNSLNKNNNENNNYNNEENNNGGNISLSPNSNIVKINQNNNDNKTSGNNIIKNNNNNYNSQFLKDDPKKFSNLAKALKYLGNKDNSNINIIQEKNNEQRFEYNINYNNHKKDNSNEKINLNTNNKSKKNIIRNFDIQTKSNTQNTNLVTTAEEYKKGKNIWSNINKDLVPTKTDLNFNFNKEDNKDETPLKKNEKYYRIYYAEKYNEANNNKINGGENHINQILNEESKYDTEENNKNFISYKIRIKDVNEISKPKNDELSNLKKYKSNKIIKVTYDQGRRNNKSIKDGNSNKNENSLNQNKTEDIKNLANSKTNNNTKSSPNFLLNNVRQKYSKSPNLSKDKSEINININSNNGKSNYRDNLENKTSKKIINNIPIDQSNLNSQKNNQEEQSVNRMYFDREKNKNKILDNEMDNIDNDKMNKRVRDLKQIMTSNRNFNSRNGENNNENGIKIENNNDRKIIINKNLNLFNKKKETNKIIFHKKPSQSPPGNIKKSNITNDNISTKSNIKYAVKINHRNFSTNNNIKISTSENINKNKPDEQIDLKQSEKLLNKTNNDIMQKENKINQNISKDTSISNGSGSGSNCNVYIRHTVQKKISKQNIVTKDNKDNDKNTDIKLNKKSKINIIKRNNINDNDIIDNYPYEKIKEKIKSKYKKIIKYYDFYIRPPKVKQCSFTNILIKNIKYPLLDICHISKMNSIIYILYKNKNICYITKARKRIKKIIQPPINFICEYSKNIILNKVKKVDIINNNNQNNDNKTNENKPEIITTKKNKKRKKRRKTRKLHKESNDKNNINLTDNKKENTDITSKDISKEENEKDNYEKVTETNIKNLNNDINNDINNININIKTPEEKNIISIPKKYMINDKSSQEEKSLFSDKEILIDLDRNSSSVRKKLSPTTYNDEEFNEEENDDFRLGSEDDYLSDDKIKKKKFDTFDKLESRKTEGKEIIGDYDLKNKLKYKEGLELLEKLNDKRIINNFNENEGDEGEYNEDGPLDYGNNEEINENSNNIDNLNKNILLGADKLNLIFKCQKNLKLTSEEDNDKEDDNYDGIYTDSNMNVNNSDSEKNNKIIINKKKNLTYKNNYEKIETIFDKLEEIFEKKKGKKNLLDENEDKYKTPIITKGLAHTKNRISDFCLKNEDYIINEIIDEESAKKRKNTYNEKGFNINKYQDIFNNQQQIISKLELLMNRQKIETNNEEKANLEKNNIYNTKIFNYNSPKIESEIDSDMNVNKDTPGNRKEICLFQINQKSNPNIINVYSLEEIFSIKNKNICQDISLLSNEVLNHCYSITKTIKDEYSTFKINYKDIKVNIDNQEKTSMDKWARKDMSKEIEKAEKYVKELSKEMSKDNYRHKIIEILNTLTVDNYKNILNSLFILIFLEENNNNNIQENNTINNNINISFKNYTLNKPEYLLHNQFIFVEIILEKTTIEKGYIVLYAKLCADLFIELIKYAKDNNNQEIENKLINGENLKTILTSECKQKFDECISMETLYKNKNKDNEDNKELFLIFKKKFLGNMDFIAELIKVKLLSQTKGFEFLDTLYKRYKEIQNEQIKYLNLEGAIILLTKFGKIVYDRKNPKHLQNLDNYIKDNICPIVDKKDKNLPNYLKFKIINLIEKKKNNWKDSLYEQSIIAKGKNINLSILYHEHSGIDNINIDESIMDPNNKIININNKSNLDIELEKENNIIILIKNDLENYVAFLNSHQIYSFMDLIEKDNSGDLNNEYDWSMTEELIVKENNNLEEIIRCYIEVCIDYVQKEQNIFYCNEYIKNIINYYSIDLNEEQTDKLRNSMIDLFLNIENICIDNFFMFEIMGYLMLLLLENYLFDIDDLDIFLDEDKNKIGKIGKVVKFTTNYYQGDKKEEFHKNLEKTKLFENNKDVLNG